MRRGRPSDEVSPKCREELTERPAVLLAEATGRAPGFFENGEDDVPAFEDLTLEEP